MNAEELIELLKSKDRLFYYYNKIAGNDPEASEEAKAEAERQRKDINNELKKALISFAHSYREVKKLTKYLDKF